MGFSERWLDKIRCCVTSAYFSVLVNGEASGYFKSSRGLRQGDSLSPFLFIAVMEVLTGILNMAQEADLVHGFCMNEERQTGRVSHILYADDAMVFCDATADQVSHVFAALICFECITGLKVNLHKSFMFAVGSVPEMARFAALVGCQVSVFPTYYLGLPLGVKSFSEIIWDPVLVSLEKKIQSWKTRFLSFGGRIALLKSVLSGLPIYFMSLFKAPAKVIKKLEAIQCRFLWTGDIQKGKVHWVAWDMVKTPKKLGGLGIQDLKILNDALLSKWVWRYAIERRAWWRSLLVAKCGIGRSVWRARWELGSTGYSIWRWIVPFNSLFWRHGFLDPGGGMCDFWFDCWVKGVRLCEVYPRIAAAAQSSNSLISDLCSFDSGWIWNIPLTTSLRGGALEEWNQLLEYLARLPPDFVTGGPAWIIWSLEGSGAFSVRSLRLWLSKDRFQGSLECPHHTIWAKGVPPKIQSFCWMVWHKKIASVDNLQRRGMTLVNRCAMCEKNLESVDHLFIHCEFAVAVWNRVSSILSLFGPRNEDVRGLFAAWKGMNCIPIFENVVGVVL
ncbi:Putative ribonuclease H protein At1g65750, partial [Linum perenne]